MATIADDCPDFNFIEFNERRKQRGADAARYDIDGEWVWMSRKDIEENITLFGEHPALMLGRLAYKAGFKIKTC